MKTKKLYIFDLDGTLVDAYTAIEKSMNFTLKKLGLPRIAYNELKTRVGRGDRLFMRSFFPEKDIERALKIYRPHHKKALLKYARLKPYAKKLLYTLKRRKKFLAIASNRPGYLKNKKIKKFGIKKFFIRKIPRPVGRYGQEFLSSL